MERCNMRASSSEISEEGEWVRYADAAAEIAKLRAEIAAKDEEIKTLKTSGMIFQDAINAKMAAEIAAKDARIAELEKTFGALRDILSSYRWIGYGSPEDTVISLIEGIASAALEKKSC